MAVAINEKARSVSDKTPKNAERSGEGKNDVMTKKMVGTLHSSLNKADENVSAIKSEAADADENKIHETREIDISQGGSHLKTSLNSEPTTSATTSGEDPSAEISTEAKNKIYFNADGTVDWSKTTSEGGPMNPEVEEYYGFNPSEVDADEALTEAMRCTEFEENSFREDVYKKIDDGQDPASAIYSTSVDVIVFQQLGEAGLAEYKGKVQNYRVGDEDGLVMSMAEASRRAALDMHTALRAEAVDDAEWLEEAMEDEVTTITSVEPSPEAPLVPTDVVDPMDTGNANGGDEGTNLDATGGNNLDATGGTTLDATGGTNLDATGGTTLDATGGSVTQYSSWNGDAKIFLKGEPAILYEEDGYKVLWEDGYLKVKKESPNIEYHVYSPPSESDTIGTYLNLQEDGNWVIYKKSGDEPAPDDIVLWQSGTEVAGQSGGAPAQPSLAFNHELLIGTKKFPKPDDEWLIMPEATSK